MAEGENAAGAEPAIPANKTLLEIMPKQEKLHQNIKTIHEHGLDLPTEPHLEEIQGFHLVTGVMSSGKTSVASRFIGFDILASASKLATRAAQFIALVHSPGLTKESIDLFLPELKKRDGTVREGREMRNLSSKECQKALKDFHDAIRKELGKEEIVTGEIRIVLRSHYVPTMNLLDVPGASQFSKAGDVCKQILEKYFQKYDGGKIHPLICSNVLVDGAIDSSQASIRDATSNTALLEKSLIVLTHIDKSNDDDYTNYEDEDDPIPQKTSPYWKMVETLNGHHSRHAAAAMFGLYNKSTTDKKQKDVRIHEQMEVEEKWIEKRVSDGEISAEDAKKLGIKALAKELDTSSLTHLEGFLEKSKTKSVALKEQVTKDIEMLGFDPSKINIDDLKEVIGVKLNDHLHEAKLEMEEKIRSLWDTERKKVCGDGEPLNPQKGLQIATHLFLSENFRSQTKSIMAAKIREPFDDDNEGRGMQIARFQLLRDAYAKTADTLVTEYLESFTSRIESDFDFFDRLIRMTDDGIAKAENLIKSIIACHRAVVVDPLFANLHGNLCMDESVWQGMTHLVETHASKRERLNKKLQVVEGVIKSWTELLPDEK